MFSFEAAYDAEIVTDRVKLGVIDYKIVHQSH